MTSRERVLKTFAREKADRMPINYFGNGAINDKLMRHFNTDYDGVLDSLGVDFRQIYVPYTGKKLFKDIEGTIVNDTYGFYSRWAEHKDGGYWDLCNFPLENATDEQIANYPVPDPNDFDYDYALACANKYKDRALYVGNGGFADIINATGRLMGMEQILINLISEDEATFKYIDRKCKMELAQLEKMIQKLGGRADFMWIGEDLGTQIAPMISLDLYRKTIMPYHRQYINLAKAYNIPVMVHTCGSSSWVYEDFIQMGVKGVDTLQPEAANMSPQFLLEKFGGRLCFHGCISTAGALAYGSPEEVEADVKNKCDFFRGSHSYMISPTHSIQDNSPLSNVLKMYESAVKYGKY